jgi:polyribonucleotide nucleotidyltransferase
MQINIGDITLSIKKLHFLHFVQCAIQVEAVHKNGAKCVLHSNIYWKDYTETQDHLPLHVEYKEPSYSFKKFSSFRRDKTCDREILISRFIDRFLRLELSSVKDKEFFFHVQTIVFNNNFDMLQIASLAVIINLRYLFPVEIGCFSKNGKTFVFSKKDLLSFSLEKVCSIEEIQSEILDATTQFEEYFSFLATIESQYVLPKENDIAQKISREGRSATEMRPIEITNISDNSMVFSRGATSVMSFIDLIFGFDHFTSGERVQKRDNILSQYFFPHFATQEGRKKPLSRRELGHSELIRTAFSQVVDRDLIIRIVSETLSADGSSSMAAVCAASACLFKMNLINLPIAGISIGFSDKILVDLSAEEDRYSIMDCKIVGDGNNICTIQMDCKKRVPFSIFFKALSASKKPIKSIIKQIQSIQRENHYMFTNIDRDKIGYVIGKAGATKKNICYHIPSRMAINENGSVVIYSEDVTLVDLLLEFYGREHKEKSKVAFFALEDFNGQTVKTTIGIVQTNKKVQGQKNDIIIGIVKEGTPTTIQVKEILSKH